MIWSRGKIGLVIGLAGLVALSAFWYSKLSSQSKPVWKTALVEKGPLEVTVTATGTLQALVTVQVGTQVSGTVSAIYADFNSLVKKGQVVARIDTTLLVATRADAFSNLERALAQESQASGELKRSQALFAKTLISQSDLDQATANARVATANLNSAKAQLERAKINLRYATIISPIDGIVLSRAVDVGQTVAANFNTPTLFTLAGDLRQMQVQASVDEADIGKIKVGQNVTFTVDAYPDTPFNGEVKQIRLQPQTVQNVVSYGVIIAVPNPDLKLMPGMTANLTVTVMRKENVLIIPSAAFRFTPPGFEKKSSRSKKSTDSEKQEGKEPGEREAAGEGGRERGIQIYVLEAGMPKSKQVRIGLTNGTQTEIESDVAVGASVITGIEGPSRTPTAATPFGMPKSSGGGRYH